MPELEWRFNDLRTNLRIGEILAERGYVDAWQMEQALAYQKEHRDKRVGQILIELKFVTEQQDCGCGIPTGGFGSRGHGG